MNASLKKLPSNARPRERLAQLGSGALSDYELLALVLGFGGKGRDVLELSKSLLNSYGSLGALFDAKAGSLQAQRNIGLAKACLILAIGEIYRRILVNGKESLPERERIDSPEAIFNIVHSKFLGKEREHLYLLSLDTRMRLISLDLLSVGTVNESLIHPREVFKFALEKNAVSVVLVHNHPSGDSNPSEDDIKITQRVRDAGLNIGVKLIDHLIVTDSSYSSMRSAGFL